MKRNETLTICLRPFKSFWRSSYSNPKWWRLLQIELTYKSHKVSNICKRIEIWARDFGWIWELMIKIPSITFPFIYFHEFIKANAGRIKREKSHWNPDPFWWYPFRINTPFNGIRPNLQQHEKLNNISHVDPIPNSIAWFQHKTTNKQTFQLWIRFFLFGIDFKGNV